METTENEILKDMPETVEELKAQFGVLIVAEEDIIVLMVRDMLTDAAMNDAQADLRKMFPKNKVLILDEGSKLGIVKKGIAIEGEVAEIKDELKHVQGNILVPKVMAKQRTIPTPFI